MFLSLKEVFESVRTTYVWWPKGNVSTKTRPHGSCSFYLACLQLGRDDANIIRKSWEFSVDTADWIEFTNKESVWKLYLGLDLHAGMLTTHEANPQNTFSPPGKVAAVEMVILPPALGLTCVKVSWGKGSTPNSDPAGQLPKNLCFIFFCQPSGTSVLVKLYWAGRIGPTQWQEKPPLELITVFQRDWHLKPPSSVLCSPNINQSICKVPG